MERQRLTMSFPTLPTPHRRSYSRRIPIGTICSQSWQTGTAARNNRGSMLKKPLDAARFEY